MGFITPCLLNVNLACKLMRVYELLYKKSALKALSRVSPRIRARIQAELKCVAADPDRYGGDWKPLKGSPYWRLRVGGYRAICEVEKGRLILLVLKVGPRGDVYK